jgi:YVTN family beta-propeller protein
MARMMMIGWAARASVIAWAGEARPADAPKVYVGLFRDNAVAVIDTGTNRVLRTIPVPKGPHGLVVTPDGRKVYVSSESELGSDFRKFMEAPSFRVRVRRAVERTSGRR